MGPKCYDDNYLLCTHFVYDLVYGRTNELVDSANYIGLSRSLQSGLVMIVCSLCCMSRSMFTPSVVRKTRTIVQSLATPET